MPKITVGFSENAISDLQGGQKQMAQMALYWGASSNALQAQVKNLIQDRVARGIVELIEVTNEDMDRMREFLVEGVPTMFSEYPDGTIKLYPIPERN